MFIFICLNLKIASPLVLQEILKYFTENYFYVVEYATWHQES